MEDVGTFEPYVRLKVSLLGDARFTACERLVVARISGFETYCETSQHCAEFLGISKASVDRAKAKLINLGVLVEIAFDGRIKTYQVRPYMLENNDDCESSCIKLTKQVYQNDKADMSKRCSYIKEDIKADIDSSKEEWLEEPCVDSSKEDSDGESQTEFGNPDINEALKLWEDATSYDFKGNQYERRAVYNLLRRKDILAYGGFKPLCELVKRARHIDNQFAPKIVKPSELGGKYSKFEKLLEWSKREEQSSQATPARKFERRITEQESALISSYYKPVMDRYEEEKPMTAEEEAEWKQARHEETMRARAIFEQKMREKREAKERKKQ